MEHFCSSRAVVFLGGTLCFIGCVSSPKVPLPNSISTKAFIKSRPFVRPLLGCCYPTNAYSIETNLVAHALDGTYQVDGSIYSVSTTESLSNPDVQAPMSPDIWYITYAFTSTVAQLRPDIARQIWMSWVAHVVNYGLGEGGYHAQSNGSYWYSTSFFPNYNYIRMKAGDYVE